MVALVRTKCGRAGCRSSPMRSEPSDGVWPTLGREENCYIFTMSTLSLSWLLGSLVQRCSTD